MKNAGRQKLLGSICLWAAVLLLVLLSGGRSLSDTELRKPEPKLPKMLTPSALPPDMSKPSSSLTSDEAEDADGQSGYPGLKGRDYCVIQNDDDSTAWYFTGFQPGGGFALFMDPTQCGLPDPYPFKITDVHLYLYDFTGAAWPVEIQVNIRSLFQGDKCNGPGSVLCSQIYSVPVDSAWDLIHLDLDSSCSVHDPFFLEIIYTGESDSAYPSLLMTDTLDLPDTCDAWAWYFWDTQYWYLEWSEFWAPPLPGYPVMRIGGYTRAVDIDSVQCFLAYDANNDSIAALGDSLTIIGWALSNPDFLIDSMVANVESFGKGWIKLTEALNNNRIFRKTLCLDIPLAIDTAAADLNTVTMLAWGTSGTWDSLSGGLENHVDLDPPYIHSSFYRTHRDVNPPTMCVDIGDSVYIQANLYLTPDVESAWADLIDAGIGVNPNEGLYDDGTHGDSTAGDNVFSLVLEVTQPPTVYDGKDQNNSTPPPTDDDYSVEITVCDDAENCVSRTSGQLDRPLDTRIPRPVGVNCPDSLPCALHAQCLPGAKVRLYWDKDCDEADGLYFHVYANDGSGYDYVGSTYENEFGDPNFNLWNSEVLSAGYWWFKIETEDDCGNLGDYSCEVEAYVGDFIAVSSPNGGEIWCAGSTHDIEWTCSGIANVNIEYSTNGGAQWNVVVSNTSCDGSHPWPIPNTQSSNCLVRICDAADWDPCDTSDAVFTIDSIPVAPSNCVASDTSCVKVHFCWQDNSNQEDGFNIYRNGSFLGSVGANATCFDDYTGTPGQTYSYCVKAHNDCGESDQCCDNGTKPAPPAVPSNCTASDDLCDKVHFCWKDNSNNEDGFNIYRNGTFLGSVEANVTCYDDHGGTPAQTYRYCATAYKECESDSCCNNGTVTPEEIAVTSPNGGENWLVGSTHDIIWTCNCLDSVELEYTTNGGTKWNLIASGLPCAQGSHPWIVPNTPSGNCVLRVSDAYDGDPMDTSDSSFTISPEDTAEVFSDFESGHDGWTVIGDGTYSWQNSGGNPGGWLRVDDDATGETAWAKAPLKFLGDWTGYNYIATDARMISGTAGNVFEFQIGGPGGRAYRNTGVMPAGSWQTFQANLQEHLWSVTQGTWEDLVQDIDEFLIRAEFVNGDEACGIDNVVLSGKYGIEVLSPSGGETWCAGKDSTIRWSSSNIDLVKIEYSTNGGTEWIVVVSETPSDGSYLWSVPDTVSSTDCFVRVCNIAGLPCGQSDSSFSILQVPTFPPTLVWPTDGATSEKIDPTYFDWNVHTDATCYRLQVDDDSSFSNPEYDSSGITSTDQDVYGLYLGGTYYWRVSASNACGTSDWSSIWHFTTCATQVSGVIGGEIWTPANSPYCVVGDILVASLEIQPGVTVKFLGDFVFEVAGVLTAIGTQQDSIIFINAYADTGWQGVFFNFSSPGSNLQYCRVEGSINSGIRIENTSPVIKNSIVKSNKSSNHGAGIFIDNGSPLIEDCIIKGNRSSNYGGGLYSNSEITLLNCKIDSNVAVGRLGGGVCAIGPLTLINCAVSDNSILYTGTSTAAGGGIYSTGRLTINHCAISGNQSRAYGGAAYKAAYALGGGIYHSEDSLVLNNCTIRDNLARAGANTAAEVARGGGVYVKSGTADLANSLLAHDSLYSRELWSGSAATGGGVYVESGDVTLTNCAIAYNAYEGLWRKSGGVIVRNSILFFNSRSQIYGEAMVTYSDVQGDYPGEGNENLNPIFLSEDSLIIVPGSPCIDGGNPDAVYNDVCFPPSLGTARNDMGAYGGPGACDWLSDTSASITLHIPNGGENWCSEDIDTIEWFAPGMDTIKIDYSTSGGASWINIVEKWPSHESYPWAVPDVLSDNCLVRVCDMDDSPCDQSDTCFSISRETLDLSSPNGKESWGVDSTQNIIWESDCIENVNIEYTTDGGTSWIDIDSNVVSNGSYPWQVPDTPSDSCLIRICDTDGIPCDTSDSFFTVTRQNLALTSPNGGETWCAEDTQEISWLPTLVDSVILLYSTDAGSNWDTVASCTTHVDDYAWKVPNTPSTLCRVKVCDCDGSPCDESDSNFSILSAPSAPTLVSPDSGVGDVGVDPTGFEWNPSSWANSYWLQVDDSSTFSDPEYDSSGIDGTYQDVYGLSCGKTYYWRVKARNVCDTSAWSQRYHFDTILPSITVISPDGEENWCGENEDTIKWEPKCVPNVSIDYSTDGGSTWQEVTSSTSSDGNFPWTVPNVSSSSCLIRICDTERSICDTSNDSFTITAQSITVTYPNGGEVFYEEDTITCTWSCTCFSDPVKIEYSTDAGNAWVEIIGTTPNDGEYDWTLPPIDSDSCKIKIADAADGTPHDESDSNFTIIFPPPKPNPPPEEWIRYNSPLILTFSRHMDPSTFDTNNISVMSMWADSGSTYDWGIDTTQNPTFYIRADSGFYGMDKVVIRLDGSIKDTFGRCLDVNEDGEEDCDSSKPWDFYIYPLGDYDANTVVNGDDVAGFTVVWNTQDTSKEIGPARKGTTPPHLLPQPDSVIDFEDLVVFVWMWNWFHQQASFSPYVFAQEGNTHLDDLVALTPDSLIGQSQSKEFGLVLKDVTDVIVVRIILEYDPAKLLIECAGEGPLFSKDGAKVLFLKSIDNQTGITEIASSRLLRNASGVGGEEPVARVAMKALSCISSEPLALYYKIWDSKGHMLACGQSTINLNPGKLIPSSYQLFQSFPNPFNPQCMIGYDLPVACRVRLSIHNTLGQKLKILVDEYQSAGHKSASWDGTNQNGGHVASGVYFYRLRAGDFVESKKMVLMK